MPQYGFIATTRSRTAWLKIKGKIRCRGHTLVRTPKGTSHRWVCYCGVKQWPCAALLGLQLCDCGQPEQVGRQAVGWKFEFLAFLKYNSIYSTSGHVKTLIQHEMKLSALFASRHPRVLYFHTHKHRWCFKCFTVLPSHLARSEFLEYPNCFKFWWSDYQLSVICHIIYL